MYVYLSILNSFGIKIYQLFFRKYCMHLQYIKIYIYISITVSYYYYSILIKKHILKEFESSLHNTQ